MNVALGNIDGDKALEPIYVVGFPKSGNTWLVRLLADVLRAPVRSGVMKGGVEIASDINKELSLSIEDALYEIQKIHFLPPFFFKEIEEEPKQIVYIYRDIRDVAVSAFFYFRYKGNEDDVRTASFSSVISRTPRSAFGYYHNRIRMLHYVKLLCMNGLNGHEKEFGTWSQHLAEWRDVSKRSNVNMAFISYEQLLNDTASAISLIINQLNLPNQFIERIQGAVARQSLKTQKRNLQKRPDNAEITFGKEFNLNFLRKGVSGDWKNFLSQRMGRIIHKYHGKMLFELGYESDPHWYEKIKPNNNIL